MATYFYDVASYNALLKPLVTFVCEKLCTSNFAFFSPEIQKLTTVHWPNSEPFVIALGSKHF